MARNTCGCFKTQTGKLFTLTEVVTHNEFFDYEAKYEGKVDEITPARISNELTNEITATHIKLYDLVVQRIVRADYI